VFTILYFVSFALDAVDGHVARLLKQTSKFGEVLDMVTDRFSTAALVLILSHFYKDYILLFQILNILDFVSHWYRMYSGLYMETGKTIEELERERKDSDKKEDSHKNTRDHEPYILNLYYSSKIFMCWLCVGNELFYIFLYYTHFNHIDSVHYQYCQYFLGVPWLGKQIMNVIQLYSSSLDINNHEEKLKLFAIGGLCNCCLDPMNQQIILDNEGINLIIQYCLKHRQNQIKLDSMTTLYYLSLSHPSILQTVAQKEVLDCLRLFQTSTDAQLRNCPLSF